MSQLKVKLLSKNAKLPTKAHFNDAAYDLYSAEQLVLQPGITTRISTDIAMEIPYGYAGCIWDRSSLGSKGIHRFAGLIDPSFRGCVSICLYNSTSKPYVISIGDRITQIVIQKVTDLEIVEVDELTPTNRGDKGFGSSGT